MWLAYYEPNAEEFERDEGDWFPVDREEMVGNMGKAFEGDPRHDDVVALTSLIEKPTKWGLYDRDALENWTEGRVGLVGDAAHPMLPTFGQGAAQAFEDAAALGKCFELHGTDIYRALLHYERVRYYRATRFQFASKFLFKHLEPEDSPAAPEDPRCGQRAGLPRLRSHGACGQRRLVDLRVRRARRSATSCRSGSSGRGTSARGRRRSTAPAGRSPAASGSRRSRWTGDRPVTREELAQHATFDDCWVVIRGKVYDFTEWKDHHPGGPFVARMYGGKDATAEFGDYHSPLAERHMEHFCVGPLVGAPAERAGDAV